MRAPATAAAAVRRDRDDVHLGVPWGREHAVRRSQALGAFLHFPLRRLLGRSRRVAGPFREALPEPRPPRLPDPRSTVLARKKLEQITWLPSGFEVRRRQAFPTAPRHRAVASWSLLRALL